MCLHKLFHTWKDVFWRFNLHCWGGDSSQSAKSIRRGTGAASLPQRWTFRVFFLFSPAEKNVSQHSSLSWVFFNEYVISVLWLHGIAPCESVVEHMTALLGQKCSRSRFQPMLNRKTMWRCEQMPHSDALMRTRQNTFRKRNGDNVLMRHHYLFTVLTPVVSVNKAIINPCWFIFMLGFLYTPI